MHPFHYRLFGLTIASDFALPELPPGDGARPDVAIRSVERLEGRGYRLEVDGVARFEIERGEAIDVERLPGVPDANVRLFLLGSVFGALLHQRGAFPLHANAVVIGGRAIAFTGPSGSGKSTLAAWFGDHDHHVIADDVCVIDSDEAHRVVVRPGLPRLRLWRDALKNSGRNPDDYRPSFEGALDDRDKFDVPLVPKQVERAYPLSAVVHLVDSPHLAVRRLDARACIAVLVENTYRGYLVRQIGMAERHFEMCVRLARTIPLLECRRPLARSSPGMIAHHVLDALG